MDKKYNKIIVKSLNELKEAFNSPYNEEIISVLNEISGWVLTNKAKHIENNMYYVCDGKYVLESSFRKYENEQSHEDLELFIHFKNTTDIEDKNIYVLYDYKYDFDTESGLEGTKDVGFNKVTSKVNENEQFDIKEITLYMNGSDEAMIHNPVEYTEQITNIVKSTTI